MAVSSSMGVISPLLAKLTTLMGDEYKKLKGVRKQISFLHAELTTMNAFLEKMALMDDDDGLDPLAKDWRSHVREMAYDMEDCIDDFMCHFYYYADDAGFIRKTARRLKTLRARYRISSQINDLKALVVEANERRMRYNLTDDYTKSGASSTFVPVDPRISGLYKDSASLVGIDGPIKELIDLLSVDGDVEQQRQRKVVSIVGFGGLGKTTLAKQVYDKIKGQFDFKAFISVSQRPDVTRLLYGIQSDLGIVTSSEPPEVQKLIDDLRVHLQHGRYIIVVDDLWDQAAWDIIGCAFPENDKGSRVIVTTRMNDVAWWTCGNHQYIYIMKPLNDEDSRRLFFKRVFGSEDGCPWQYGEVSSEILKKCGGLPLAIITISSLLASRPARIMQEWENIRNSLGTMLGAHPTLEGMRRILNLSYKNLPIQLRTCLLYLCKFPEDYVLERDNLVREWIAEGFVSMSCEQEAEYVGKSYFNDLINRGLIQPKHTNNCGEVESCTVHDMMLDLILRKCKEDNFIHIAHSCKDYADMTRLHGSSRNKVRRLSLHLNNVESDCTTLLVEGGGLPAVCLAQVRSVSMFGGPARGIPLFLPFKYIRVLYIKPHFQKDRFDLTCISQLLQLRSLMFDLSNGTVELPTRLCGLVHLDTLDINAHGAVNSLSDIGSLPCLSHLRLPVCTRLPNGIKKIKRTLQRLSIELPPYVDVKALGELTNLKELRFRFNREAVSSSGNFDALGTCIRKLNSLRILDMQFVLDRCFMHGSIYYDDNRLGSLSDFPRSIEILKLYGWCFSSVPRWMNAALCNLRILVLVVSEMSTDGVDLLGELPSLMDLNLSVKQSSSEESQMMFGYSTSSNSNGSTVRSRGSAFPSLQILSLFVGENAPSSLSFAKGVMPNLRDLTLHFNWHRSCMDGTPAGMDNLLTLQRLTVYMSINRKDRQLLEPDKEEAVKYAFGDIAREHPNRPSFQFKQVLLFSRLN
uniref:Uncharacterized protein n=1 Tax=Leersia perrieri TaxID=77586 RepID=A0A0D9X3J8_9ORYZ